MKLYTVLFQIFWEVHLAQDLALIYGSLDFLLYRGKLIRR